METVGEALKVGLCIGFDQAQPVADDLFQRLARTLGLADQQP